MLNRWIRSALIGLVVAVTVVVVVSVVDAPVALADPPIVEEEIYTVTTGDTLASIARRFNADLAAIIVLNNLENPNLIYVGQQLRIPLVKGDAVVDDTIVSTGGPITSTQPLTNTVGPQKYTVQQGDTLYQIAVRFGVGLTELANANAISNVDLIEVGQELIIPSHEPIPEAELPTPFRSVTLSAEPLVQGRTVLVGVSLDGPGFVSGEFDGRPILFNRYEGDAGGMENKYWGLLPVHSMQGVSLYPLTLVVEPETGSPVTATLYVQVVAGPYGTENIQLAPGMAESLLDPQLVQDEFNKISSLWSVVTPQKGWEGKFALPMTDSVVTSDFGTRRSYNSGPVGSYHAGTDFKGAEGEPVYASAGGKVVMAEGLVVRGNVVLVDHGLGVFTGYWHLSGIAVKEGQQVRPGDLLGYVGSTGLVTGPHLHWELRVRGIAVDPIQWTQEQFPADDAGTAAD